MLNYIAKVFVILLCSEDRRGYMDDQSLHDIEKDKKRFLRRYQNNLACISRLEAKLVIVDERITTIKSPNYSGMPRGGVPITLEDLIADKDDLERRIKKLRLKSRDLKRSVYEEIDTIEDTRYCEILEAHFIDGLSFVDIAEKMGYAERHVRKLYAEAIKCLAYQ